MNKNQVILIVFSFLVLFFCGMMACGLDTNPNADLEKLTTRYCARCHHAPDPRSLTKEIWENSIMPKMSKYFKWSEKSVHRYANRSIYNETGTIPMKDTIWNDLIRYYVNHGLEKPIEKVYSDLPVQDFFEVKTVKNLCGGRGITAVSVDEANSTYLAACDSSIMRIDTNGTQIFTLNTSGLVSGIFPIDHTSAWITDPGILDPHNQSLGRLMKWEYENDDIQVIKEGLSRPVYLNDHSEGLFISEFGNEEGRLSELNYDGSGFKSASNLPGGYKSIIFDYDKDGRDEILVMFAQALEGVYVREVAAKERRLVPVVSFGPEWGISDIDTADVNRDGWTDLIVVNGDNADYSTIPKSFHGVRVYLNNKSGKFEEAYNFPLHGATQVQSMDANGDGRVDLLVGCFFSINDSNNLLLLIDNGDGSEISYTPYRIGESDNGRWMVAEVGDVDNDGDTDAIIGSFKYIDYDLSQMKNANSDPDILLLLNQSK